MKSWVEIFLCLLYRCGIIKASNALLPIDYFLKEAHQFPEQAIEDVKLLIELLKVKYKKERHQHKAYWDKQSGEKKK